MKIVWDEAKRKANLAKHGLDFAAFASSFQITTARVIATRPSRTGRTRDTLIGRWNGVTVVVAILSPLGSEAVALVSLRAASRKERSVYDES